MIATTPPSGYILFDRIEYNQLGTDFRHFFGAEIGKILQIFMIFCENHTSKEGTFLHEKRVSFASDQATRFIILDW